MEHAWLANENKSRFNFNEEASNNWELITRMAELDVNIQFGGGIRYLEDVDWAIKSGIKRVIIGTAANPTSTQCPWSFSPRRRQHLGSEHRVLVGYRPPDQHSGGLGSTGHQCPETSVAAEQIVQARTGDKLTIEPNHSWCLGVV